MNAVEQGAMPIISGKLYFLVAKRMSAMKAVAQQGVLLHVDSELVYEPFASDFGPLNAGMTYRFCQKLNALMQEASARDVPVYFVSGSHPHKKANAAVLLGVWQVLYLARSAREAYAHLRAAEPFVAFRDASSGPSLFNLTVFHCIAGAHRAKEVGFLDWHMPNSKFDVKKYEHYEQVQHGDWNWVVPGKFVAVSGPSARRSEQYGYCTLGCADYFDVFKQEGVTAIVRLSKKQYDRSLFVNAGFRHYDLYFPDGTCPPDHILTQFLEIAENESGALAVHCKAGVGRTGTLICCFIMKHFGFTAEECFVRPDVENKRLQAMGYIRICRPGCVLGPQQLYLKEQQARMWAAGGIQRALECTPSRSLVAARATTPDIPSCAARLPPTSIPRSLSAGTDSYLNTYSNFKNASGKSTGSTRRATVGSSASMLPRNLSAAELRATLHTDTVRNAMRPVTQIDKALSLTCSEPFSSGSTSSNLRRAPSLGSSGDAPVSAPSGLYISKRSSSVAAGSLSIASAKQRAGAQTPDPASLTGYRGGMSYAVSRTTAPNGQPRKVWRVQPGDRSSWAFDRSRKSSSLYQDNSSRQQ